MPDLCLQSRKGSANREGTGNYRNSLYQRNTGQKQLSGKRNTDLGKHTEGMDGGDKADNASAQQEIEQPKPLKEGKVAVGTGNVAVSLGNVVHHVAVNSKNACNSRQSKVK